MNGDNLIGRRFDDKYEIHDVIGAGGMGTVYRARDDHLNRWVAIKVLAPSLAAQPGYSARFNQEARTIAALQHANIVSIFGYGNSDGYSYFVMPLLGGGTLASRLTREQPLPSPGEVAALLHTLADALDYAHSQDVIHRDIKASNILFDENGHPYIADFGIARLQSNNQSLTQAGRVMGAPGYMSPEQWKGEPLTGASDQYALAVLVYLMVTGRMPFEADNTQALMQMHLGQPPPPPDKLQPTLPKGLRSVLDRALAKEPGQRFPNNAAFAEAFQAAIKGKEGKPAGLHLARRTKSGSSGTQHQNQGQSGEGDGAMRLFIGLVSIVILALIGLLALFLFSSISESNSLAQRQTEIALIQTETAIVGQPINATIPIAPPPSQTAGIMTVATITPTATSSATGTRTLTPSRTATATSTRTLMPTRTSTATSSATRTRTMTPSRTATRTLRPSLTPSPTATLPVQTDLDVRFDTTNRGLWQTQGMSQVTDYQWRIRQDPQMTYQRTLSVCLADFSYFSITILVPTTLSDQSIQVFYQLAGEGETFVASRSFRIPLITDGRVRRYVYPLADLQLAQTARLTDLRLDPVDGPTRGQSSIVLRDVRLIRNEFAPTSCSPSPTTRPTATPTVVPETARFDFDVTPSGIGWSVPEQTGNITFVWMRATSATLIMHVDAEGDLLLTGRIFMAMSPSILQSLTLTVNGQAVDLSIDRSESPTLFRARIPQSVLDETGSSIVLRFSVNRIIRPSSDSRSLGLAFDWVNLSRALPATATPLVPATATRRPSSTPRPTRTLSPTPQNATSTIVTVSAQSYWTGTGITVTAGQRVTVEYVSELWGWCSDCQHNAEPGGDNFNFYGIDVPIGTLIGRVGSGGTTRAIGNRLSWVSQEDGELFLMMNDARTGLNDNQGSIRVRVWVSPNP